MGGDTFRFKEFVIRQRLSAMKVGTDGVILGAWAALDSSTKKILDVGTGTGLIAMMIAQRAPEALVDAVEIDREAASEARENFERCPFSDRMQLYNSAFQSFADECGERYDLIVSNPPYFNGTYKSVDAQRTAARHRELLPTDDLIEGVLKLLNDSGRFVAIFPYSDAAVFIAKAAARGLYCSKIMEIHPKSGRAAIRMAAEFSLAPTANTLRKSLVILDEAGVYTSDYRDLTIDFYLRF